MSITLSDLSVGFTVAGGTTSKTLTVSGDANVSGTNTGDVTLSGENYLSISGQVLTAHPVDLSRTNVTGTLPAASLPSNQKLGAVGTVIDGGGVPLTTGQKGYILCPYAGTITSATLIADQVGSCVIDVWKAAYPTIPTVANTIVA